MPKHAAFINAYIAKAPEWQRPLLKSLRAMAAKAGLDAVVKWSHPFYEVGGVNVLSTHSAKGWLSIHFYDGALIPDKAGIFDAGRPTMRHRTVKVLESGRLPPAFAGYFKLAVKNAKAGKKVVLKRTAKPLPVLSRPFEALLEKAGVLQAYQARPPYQQRGYLRWIGQAKQEVTRFKRQARMLAELRAGTYMPPQRGL